MLNISTSDGDTLIGWLSYAIFLDEFRVLVTNYDDDRAAPELVVFDTLVPQDHPESFQRFRLPLKYRNRSPHICADRDRPLGAISRSGPLAADPTQSILAVELTPIGINRGPWVLLAVRADALIGCTYSTRTSQRVLWEQWGEGAVVMEIPSNEIPLDRDDFSIFVHSSHVAIVICTRNDIPDYNLYTFDFSKRSRHALPVWNKEGNRTERKSTLENGRKLTLDGNQGMYPEDMVFLGNGTMVYLDQVGYHSHIVEGIL